MLYSALVAAALSLSVTQAPVEEAIAHVTANNDEWPGDHDHWAVLIAGSSGYGNYRHQADVCHAYQIAVKAGIKPEQIITLAADDVANSPENPYPGQLFNKPTPAGTPGTDVYAGCVIDYSGDDVTPENFVAVLTGDDTTGKKVLKSTSKSRVFVNFVDHGGVDIIGFPRTVMHATDLVAALQKMSDTSMYKELVFYLEACESGSMFQTLPDSIKIFATTAANAKESSWGTYCPPDDMVNGKSLRTCLGDLYSVKWMEDSDSNLAAGETLADQFARVKQETNKSHVQQFGDLTFAASEPTSNFQGNTDTTNSTRVSALIDAKKLNTAGQTTSLPSADAELASAYARFMATGSKTAAAELIAGVNDRLKADERFDKLAHAVMGRTFSRAIPDDLTSYNKCHYAAHKAYIAKCGEFTTGALKHSATLMEMCVSTHGKPEPIISAIVHECA